MSCIPYISWQRKFTSDYLDIVYSGRQEKYLWTGKEPKEYEDDEEMYNITGYYWDSCKCFDPISCNMFDICKQSSRPESIVQRVFHKRWIHRYQYTHTPSYQIDQFLIDVSNYIIDTEE
ncbi:MAG: hypothetical protein LBE97_01270 [Holosporales bacterium]|nr:hypothetical protein [Holosporales bacterium]